MTVRTLSAPRATEDVGRKKQDDAGDDRGRTPIGKQVNVRIPDELMTLLKEVSEDTGLDTSSVIRMILTQNVDPYVRHARERRQQRQE